MLLHLAAAWLSLLPAQDPVGQPALVRVRFVGAADGLPRPGVVVHQRADGDPHREVARTGFAVAEDKRITDLRRAVSSWRSDPAGEILLPRELFARRWCLFEAEPFSLGEPKVGADGVVTWQVYEREPVGVRALGADGKPLAGFPVALHTGGRDVSVALTDAEGRALLGMPADHSARIWLSPAGWVGPRDAMPTIASSLAGRRGTNLVVPPHGTLQLWARRGDMPAKVRIGGVHVRTEDCVWALSWHPGGELDGFGVELPFVAVGTAVQGHVDLPGSHEFTVRGPERAGDTVLHGVVVPWHPEVCFDLDGPPPHRITHQLRLRFVTDAGTVESTAQRGPNGRWQVDRGLALFGRELERIEFDMFTPGTDRTAPCCWTASLQLCADLASPAFDLGTVTLVPGPTLHGQVVDADGRPLAGVEVVAGTADRRPAYLLRTDAEGRFVWSSALPRDAAGALRPLTAHACTPTLVSATLEADPRGGPITLRLTEPAPPPPKRSNRLDGGSLAATIKAPRPQDQGQHWMLRGEQGFGARPTVTTNADGTITLQFERVMKGRYALTIIDHGGLPRIVCTGLDVPGDGPCTDPRLAGLVLHDPRVVTVRVVDRKGVPIAGVRATVAGGILTSDGNGRIRIATHEQVPLRGAFDGIGLRPRELAGLADGMDVVMSPASTFRVHVTGLPADVPADRLEVWVRHEQRERFLGPRGDVDAGGTVELATPVPGRYFVNLLVKVAKSPTQNYTTLVAIRAVPVDIGEGDVPVVEYQLDDAERARLSQRFGSGQGGR